MQTEIKMEAEIATISHEIPAPVDHHKIQSNQRRIAETGKISMHFFENFQCTSDYPENYFTLSAKERLILLFAENLRRQYQVLFVDRRPLVLAIENECGVKKFVSTTIRPSVFLYPELVGNWCGPAQFVADFITYEPLEDPIAMVSVACFDFFL